MTAKRLNAKHGVICRLPSDPRGYFGWPSVERMAHGDLLVVSSGLRGGPQVLVALIALAVAPAVRALSEGLVAS